MKALMRTLRKEVVVGITSWELKSHLFKALVLPTFMHGTENQGGYLKKLLLESLQEGHEGAYNISSQSAFFNYISYCAGQIKRTSHRIIHSQAYYGFSTMACPPIPSWLVDKATLLSQSLAERGFNTWHKLTTMWKTSWGLSHWKFNDNTTTSKTTYDDIKEVFLAKDWNYFHLFKEKLYYLHLEDLLKYKCELYLKPLLTPPQRKIIFAYCTSNHRLAIETGQWTTIPNSRNTRLCHLISYNAVENEAHFVLECPLYNPTRR